MVSPFLLCQVMKAIQELIENYKMGFLYASEVVTSIEMAGKFSHAETLLANDALEAIRTRNELRVRLIEVVYCYIGSDAKLPVYDSDLVKYCKKHSSELPLTCNYIYECIGGLEGHIEMIEKKLGQSVVKYDEN